jgi:small multidrug resistance family-3 protein
MIAKSVFFFLLAGLCEIGGGYLIWQWMREGKSLKTAVAGAVLLVIYGIIPTLQPAPFGRVYAAYGGVFIAMSVFWGWGVERVVPDRYDLLGAAVCLIGVTIMMYWPRG